MKKKINFTTQGQRADIGAYQINRLLPNRYSQAIGPFVFLDHIPALTHLPDEPRKFANGKGAHPHRGIATLTYVLNGEAEHFDSNGNYAKVSSGGLQWMKAGNGVIHDESMNPDIDAGDLLTHAFQFWVNLPAKNKAEPPAYLAVQANEVPMKFLDKNKGWIKVIAGEYEELASKIPRYSIQFLYHLHLEAGQQFILPTEKHLAYAAFLPLQNLWINDTEFKQNEIIVFDEDKGDIEIHNINDAGSDLILFGGEPYTEPIIAAGPFVMNTQSEIAGAYSDFHSGQYGQIDYGLAER